MANIKIKYPLAYEEVKKLPKQDSAFCVYKLTCPLTNEVKYVGCTKNIINRMKGHFTVKRRRDINKKLSGWIISLRRKKMVPIVQFASFDLVEDAAQAEIDTINKHKNTVFNHLKVERRYSKGISQIH